MWFRKIPSEEAQVNDYLIKKNEQKTGSSETQPVFKFKSNSNSGETYRYFEKFIEEDVKKIIFYIEDIPMNSRQVGNELENLGDGFTFMMTQRKVLKILLSLLWILIEANKQIKLRKF